MRSLSPPHNSRQSDSFLDFSRIDMVIECTFWDPVFYTGSMDIKISFHQSPLVHLVICPTPSASAAAGPTPLASATAAL